jgi:very-short-patch-repair endonuclease
MYINADLMVKIYYNSKLKEYASNLRNNATPGERKLWKYLKGKQTGYDFHRQKPINNYIVDFYCHHLKLAIEIDGSTHDENKYEYDRKRQNEIERLGITFLRFTEYEVTKNIDRVLEAIYFFIECSGKTPSPTFPQGRELTPTPTLPQGRELTPTPTLP